MAYPLFKNKHLNDAFFNPSKFKEKLIPKNFPKKFIFVYYDKLFRYFKRKYKPKKYKLNALVTVYQYKDIGFIKVDGIGAPLAVVMIELLIKNGGKQFLSLGTAGGLKQEGVFLCTKALRDEGTSHHYISKGHYSYPDKKLSKKFGKSIKDLGLDYREL